MNSLELEFNIGFLDAPNSSDEWQFITPVEWMLENIQR